MEIKIYTKREIESRREALMKQIIDLLNQQSRSCHRYATRLVTLKNKLKEYDDMIGKG